MPQTSSKVTDSVSREVVISTSMWCYFVDDLVGVGCCATGSVLDLELGSLLVLWPP